MKVFHATLAERQDENSEKFYEFWIYLNPEDRLLCCELRKVHGIWSVDTKIVAMWHRYTSKSTVYHDNKRVIYPLSASFSKAKKEFERRLDSYIEQANPRKITDFNPYYVFDSKKKKTRHTLRKGKLWWITEDYAETII